MDLRILIQLREREMDNSNKGYVDVYLCNNYVFELS